MADYQEVELKLYVPDLNAVRRRLVALGATVSKPRVFERNVRYENESRTLTADGIVVRLRQDADVRLTYKGKATKSTNGIRARFEAEVEVSDFDTMHIILDKLGYQPYMSYEKYRTTYDYGATEVVLDEMPYGHFVEIEGESDAIQQVQIDLELGDAVSLGDSYSQLFNRVRANLGLKFEDLTFKNFDGVDVPVSAFY
jgi:adenylate cyclase class 2